MPRLEAPSISITSSEDRVGDLGARMCTRCRARTPLRPARAALAVERLGEDARAGGLADAARAGEEVGMRDRPLSTAFASVRVTCACPTMSSNVCGRYAR